MSLPLHSRLLLLALLGLAALWAASCAQPFGPSYTIETQEIRVRFAPGSDPRIQMDASYKLRNIGTRPLPSLELRLPGRRRFHLASSAASWDGVSIPVQVSEANPRDTLLAFPKAWAVHQVRTLKISAEFQPPAPGETGFGFSSDAFFLPSQGWAPELLPAEGLFGSGGTPPRQWPLSVTVPQDFLVHTSGQRSKSSRKGGEITVTSPQRSSDHYPFVVSGRYKESALDVGSQKIFVWTRSAPDAASLRQSADFLARAVQTYNATFGARSSSSQPLWIVECPVVQGCFTSTYSESSFASFLSAEPGAVTSELASLDTLLLDFTGGPPKLAAAAPGLAASWLGYGQNPGFYDQQPPMTALPAFASALGQESIAGPSARTEAIRRALRVVPRNSPSRKPEEPSVVRAKSFLFFYALEDRCGREAFRRAITYVLSARRGRDFNLDDLIAAFDDQTHQNTAEFVRLWMKRPGVPDDFRARYEVASASLAAISKETIP